MKEFENIRTKPVSRDYERGMEQVFGKRNIFNKPLKQAQEEKDVAKTDD